MEKNVTKKDKIRGNCYICKKPIYANSDYVIQNITCVETIEGKHSNSIFHKNCYGK